MKPRFETAENYGAHHVVDTRYTPARSIDSYSDEQSAAAHAARLNSNEETKRSRRNALARGRSRAIAAAARNSQ